MHYNNVCRSVYICSNSYVPCAHLSEGANAPQRDGAQQTRPIGSKCCTNKAPVVNIGEDLNENAFVW